LERVLVSNGIAVLNLEWRGIGKSIGQGNYVDMTLSELLEAPRDVHEGYKFLASQKGVDPERIAVLGTALAAKLAMHAAKESAKLKALVMLTPVTWPWEQENDSKTITSLGRPVLLVTGDGFGDLTKEFADLVEKDDNNTVITYPGGVFGYLLLQVDRDLGPKIARWLKEQLTTQTTIN
jgi:dienelactone hydrolase